MQIFIMTVRGRGTGRGKGRGRSNLAQPSLPSIDSPPPFPNPHSPGTTSAIGPLTGGPSTVAPPTIGLSAVDPPTSGPTSVPSSGSGANIDRRPVISVEAIPAPKRFVPQTVTRAIMSSVLTRMPIPAERWRNYPSDVKKALFDDFMDQYRFASDYDRAMARNVWERTCMDRYPDMLKNARIASLKALNSTNLADTKGHGPKGMKSEVWDGLVDIWLTPEWRRKSDAGRSNRATMPESILHTGGSISFGQHKKKMEMELKHEVSYRDVYFRTHKKKSGEYVSDRAKNFIETLDTAMSQKYGEDSSTHPVVDPEVWIDVAGPNKKGRVHGMGHSLDLGIHGSMHASSSEATGPSMTSADLNTVVNSAVNAALPSALDVAMASFVRTQLMPMLEPILSRIPGFRGEHHASQAHSQGEADRGDHRDGDDDDTDIDMD